MSRLPLLMEDFAKRNGIGAMPPDEAGRYHILADDSVRVQCFERFGQLHLVSPLGSVPEPVEAGRLWLKRLLNHAFRRMKRSPGTPALDEAGAAVLFARFDVADLSIVEFEDRVAEHINALESYLRVIDAAGSTPPAAPFAQPLLRP